MASRMVGRAPELDPAVQELLDGIDLPPRPAQTVEASRRALDAVLIRDQPVEPVGEVREFEIPVEDGGIRVRGYVPDGTGPFPVLVYFHGGGWVRGNIDTHDDLCRMLTNAVGCAVLSVDYRLAPEHPFPRPLEDAYTAVEWAVQYADLLDGDPDVVAVGGDSAGGNLAAAVSLEARDFGGPRIAAQLLLYPITNYAFDTDSYEENAEGYLLTKRGMQWYWEHYLERELDGHHPYASPLQARDVSGLPPAVVVTAGYDPLRDEGAAYADRLESAGVSVHHAHYDAMHHAFISFPTLDASREALLEVGDALRPVLGLT